MSLITESKMEKLRNAKTYDELEELGWFTLKGMVDTLSALWKVARAAQLVKKISMNQCGLCSCSFCDGLKRALAALEAEGEGK